MIREWKIGNFKSIRETQTIDLGKMTVVTGVNSSGKSSLIQSILMVAQTLRSGNTSAPLVLNGEFVRLGTYEDVVNREHSTEPLHVGFTLGSTNRSKSDDGKHEQENSTFEFDFGCSTDASNKQTVELKHAEVIFKNPDPNPYFVRSDNPSKDELCFEIKQLSADEPSEIKIYEGRNPRPFPDHDFKLKNMKAPAKKVLFSHTEPRMCLIRNFLPIEIIGQLDVSAYCAEILFSILTSRRFPGVSRHEEFHEPAWEIIIKYFAKMLTKRIEQLAITDESKPEEKEEQKRLKTIIRLTERERFGHAWIEIERIFYFADKGLYSRAFFSQSKPNKKTIADDIAEFVKESTVHLAIKPRWTRNLQKHVDDQFATKIGYLGPLRYSPLAELPPYRSRYADGIGVRGEYTAEILNLMKDKKVNFIPPTSASPTSGEEKEQVTVALSDAVADWLKYLEIAKDTQSEDMGVHGYAIKVDDTGSGGNYFSLHHVGVGVSQLLPVLVMGLLAKPGDILLLEQPELHLHPKAQSQLADFFLSLIDRDVQVIIETHSEHLVDRLRYHIAASDDDSPRNKDIRIYFAEKPQSVTTFTEVGVDEFGILESWPKGFFDERTDQIPKIIAASIEKRKKRREKDKEAK